MEYAFRGTWTRVLVVVAVLALFTGMLWAQGGTGELTGLVTDPSGAVVAGAQVTLTNSATGEKRVETTTSAGTYRFGALQVVGAYTLGITAKGFKGYKIEHIIISVGVVTTHDARLEVGTAGETVTVEAGAQAVQTTESSLTGLLDRHVWQDMPLETRSQNEFIALLAGAEPAAVAQLGTDRGAAVNGTRSGAGNFLVEGFDNNDQGLGGAGATVGPGGANTTISPDAIQEYRVIEHLPNAEYGKAGGFVTDTVLKSGTNQWHGSLFEYNRVQALAANNWFSTHNHVKDSLVRNQFGGSVGGPIVKDKTFFFFTVEAHRERTASPLTATTMTPEFLNFVSSGAFETFQETDPAGLCVVNTGLPCPGAFSASSTLGPIFNSALSAEKFPLCVNGAPNCKHNFDPNTGMPLDNLGQGVGYTTGLVYPVDLYGQVTVPQPSSTNQMRYSAKVDQKIGARDQISGAYLYDNADSQTAFAGGDNSFGPTLFNHARAQNAGITWSHTFSPTILNQARMSYTRHTANFPGDPAVAGFPSVFTFFDSNSAGLGNSSNLPQFFTENEFTYKDDISITKGKHNLKFGGSYTRTRNGSSFQALKNALFTPYSVEDLVTDGTFGDQADQAVFGYPAYGSFYYGEASINPQTSQLPVFYRGFRANEFAFYGQDDWRVSSRLTLNLGLRWEYFGPPHNFQKGIDANYYTGSAATPFATTSTNPFMPVNNPFYAAISTGSAQQKNSNIWNKDMNNFGPRVGFAFDAMGNQKFVVRGGFGISYDRMYNNIFENIRFNPPFFAFSLIGFISGPPIGGLSTPGIYAAPFTNTPAFGGAALKASLRDVSQNLVTAYYEQANFGFQYELPGHMVLETNYVGTFGHKLLAIIGANTFDGRLSGLGSTRINPTYSSISLRGNCCSSNYHALQTTLRKQFSSGLQFNANYTYSKALDDVSDAFSTKNASSAAYPTDSMNVNFDYGPADFNVKHRVVGSVNYALPFFKGNRWLGGWGLSGIATVQTGTPFSVIDSCSACDSNKDGQFNDRASWLGSGPVTNDINHNVSPAAGYLTNAGWGQPGLIPNPLTQPNLIALPCPANVNLGLWCEGSVVSQTRRNSLVAPGYFNTDLGVSKAFKITETAKITLYGNFFNIFNHPNFGIPDHNLNDTTFGQSTSAFAPRITQLVFRFDF
jgi:hypothetical protein